MRAVLAFIVAILWLALTAPAASASPWQPGPDASGEATIDGWIDHPAPGAHLDVDHLEVSGWVVDRSASGWAGIDRVEVYWGERENGGVFLGEAATGHSRPDVAAALGQAGWTAAGFALDASQWRFSAGLHQITVYAHAPGKGWWKQSVWFSLAHATSERPAGSSPAGREEASVWAMETYRIAAPVSLWPALEHLRARQYSWVLQSLTDLGVQLVFAPLAGAWGSYDRAGRVVYLNAALAGADPATVAAVLVHEGTHVADDRSGALNSFNECISSERRATEQEVRYWQSLWGKAGTSSPANALERELNLLAAIYDQYRDEIDRYVRERYTPQCRANAG